MEPTQGWGPQLLTATAAFSLRVQQAYEVYERVTVKGSGLVSCLFYHRMVNVEVMARPLRLQFDGAIYHVTSRGNARADIFDDDGDRHAFLECLEKVVHRFHWLCHAYCLMSNHYHLVIETPEANLSKGMRQLNGIYTQGYNRRHRTVGHVFQGRYKAILIQKESHLLEVCRYVVLNPVRAKAVEKVEQWKWSSYRRTAGVAKGPPWLAVHWVLSQFSQDRHLATGHYRRFVREGIDRPSIWEGVQAQVLLGGENFVEKLQGYVKGYEAIAEIPRSQRYMSRPPLKKLFEGKRTKAKRDTIIVQAVHRYGYSQREVAEMLGLHYATISRIANKS
jgi:REP element-mobilizing transposase RayT